MNGVNMISEVSHEGHSLNNRRGVGDVIATRRHDIVSSPFRRVVRLAWPVEAWRVVAPVMSGHDLNILEVAVLRLVGAGAGRTEAIAYLLNLHPDLVALIMKDCARPGRGYLAVSSGPATLTANGQRVIAQGYELGGAVNPNGPSRDGWIFRDRLSGDICPLFHEGTLPATGVRQVGELIPLPTSQRMNASSQISEKPHPRFVQAALAKRRIFQGIEDSPDPPAVSVDEYTSVMPEIPDYLEIPDEKDWESESEPQRVRTAQSSPQRVIIVSDRPEVLDFEVLYYTAANDPNRWLMTAPLQGAGGSWYAEKLAWARGRNRDLDTLILRWEEETREQFAQTARPTAYEEVLSEPLLLLEDDEGRLPDAAVPLTSATESSLPNLEVSLFQDSVWNGARAEWVEVCKAYSYFAGDRSFLDSMVIKYQKTLEAVVNVFLEDVPGKATLARTFGREGFGARVRAMASEMGMEMPRAMSRDDSASKMMGVARGRVYGLRLRALFLFLDAYDDGRAPFYHALQEEPRLLALIDRVADLRNPHAHHNASSRSGPDADPAFVELEARQATCRVIEIMVSTFDGKRNPE